MAAITKFSPQWYGVTAILYDFGMLFICSKNSNNPKIEPCAIPQTIYLGQDICYPLTVHRFSLLVRQDLHQNGYAFFVVAFDDLLSRTVFERPETLHNSDVGHPYFATTQHSFVSYHAMQIMSNPM